MAAAIQTAPRGGQIRHLEITMSDGDTRHMAVEQIPTGYRLDLATIVNMWRLYRHMQGKVYPIIEAFLDDACPGWLSWREQVLLPIMTNAQETAIIKAALKNAGIRPKSVRHYLGPVIIEMGREEAFEDEFLQIRDMALQALDSAPGVSNGCTGVHVFNEFRGKLAAGFERFRRYKR